MRAALYERFGPASEVLRLEDLDRPEPGPGEVRVRVRVHGVNPSDWRMRNGSLGTEMPFPYVVPGQDAAGEIDAVGDGVSGDRLGERAWIYFAGRGRQHGAAAEWICLPAAQAVALPAGASLELGASLGIPALTAHRCLNCDGPLEGLTVLVAGGAGAVGHYAIELAKRSGARVIATVSSESKARLAAAAGADAVVNYREPGAIDAVREAAPGGVDRIVELAPAANADLNFAVIAPRATIAVYAPDGDLTLPTRRLMHLNASLRFVLIYEAPAQAVRAAVSEVGAALAEGALSELPLQRFPLDRIAEAHEAVEQGAVGKVLVETEPT